MLIEVTGVRPVGDRYVDLSFSDGYSGRFDMSRYFDFGVFKALRDPAFFAKVRVANGTASWPGELEIAPERLYEGCV